MFGFVKRLIFGNSPAPSPLPVPAPQPAADRIPTPPLPPRAVLQRDEMIDARTRIGGYRFAARSPDAADTIDPAATVAVLAVSQVARFAEQRLALIPLTAQAWRDFDYRLLIGPRTTFLLALPSPDESFATWRESVLAIRQAGARIALPDSERDESGAFRDLADSLLLDFTAYSLPNFERAVRRLRQERPALDLLIDHVGSWPEFRYCASLGAAYCLGAFTTSPDEEQRNEEIAQSRLVLIEMLNLLRQEADPAAIVAVAKRDPGVAVKLVAMSNSPLLGLSQPVTSIDQAILVLGREQLYRWLTIGIFRAGAGSPRDEVLLEMALARGHFLERVGQRHHGKAECDELFLLGLLSLLDSLLGQPMAKIVERLYLSDTLKLVLLDSDGPFARYLLLAIAVEKGHPENVARLAGQLDLGLEIIEAMAIEAVAWAEEAVRLTA